MRQYVVTGCAGFIGSTLTDALLARGDRVLGIDCFRDYYDTETKRENLQNAMKEAGFTLLEEDLSRSTAFINEHLEPGMETVIYHLAAQAGVRKSWGSEFSVYTRDNILATQNLLEWASSAEGFANFVYASSSSVYGIPAKLPMLEDVTVPSPHSPYGVTKLAAENLTRLYTANTGLPSVSLRFFTVYGPRQRPDMAFHRFFRAAIDDRPIGVYGSGAQTRDFTFVDDIVNGLLLAENSTDGKVMNLGGGDRITLLKAIDTMSEVIGKHIRIDFSQAKKGDVPNTWASTEIAEKELGWTPGVSLDEGLRREFLWINNR